MLTLQNRYQGNAQALSLAQISSARTAQQLRIDVAAAAWRDFTQYAETQLS